MLEDKKNPSLFKTIIWIDDEEFNALSAKISAKEAQMDELMRSAGVRYQPHKTAD